MQLFTAWLSDKDGVLGKTISNEVIKIILQETKRSKRFKWFRKYLQTETKNKQFITDFILLSFLLSKFELGMLIDSN